jgi:hypothetical protein
MKNKKPKKVSIKLEDIDPDEFKKRPGENAQSVGKRKKEHPRRAGWQEVQHVYDEREGRRLVNHMIEHQVGLKAALKADPTFPGHVAIYQWRYAQPEFDKAIRLAQAYVYECMGEGIADIVDDTSQDIIHNERGSMPNSAAVLRSRLRHDFRKWLATDRVKELRSRAGAITAEDAENGDSGKPEIRIFLGDKEIKTAS